MKPIVKKRYRIDHNFGSNPTFFATKELAAAEIVRLSSKPIPCPHIIATGNGEWLVYDRDGGNEIGMITEFDQRLARALDHQERLTRAFAGDHEALKSLGWKRIEGWIEGGTMTKNQSIVITRDARIYCPACGKAVDIDRQALVFGPSACEHAGAVYVNGSRIEVHFLWYGDAATAGDHERKK